MKQLLFLLLIIILGCSNTDINKIDYNLNSAQIINGKQALHEDYPSVGALMVTYETKPICTLVLIRPNIALTAAHCTEYDLSYLRVAYGYDDADNEDGGLILMPVLAKENHPNYHGFGSEAKSDLGLIMFDNVDSPVSLIFSGILEPENNDDVLNEGELLTIVGYGQSVEGEWGHELFAGRAPIIWRNEYEMQVGARKDEVLDPANSCYGDSGGPAYVDFDGKEYIAGITSRAPDDIVECGYGAIYTLPGSYLEWIDMAINNMKNNLDDDCPKCEACEECKTCLPPASCPNLTCPEDVQESTGTNGCSIAAVGNSSLETSINIGVILLMFIVLIFFIVMIIAGEGKND